MVKAETEEADTDLKKAETPKDTNKRLEETSAECLKCYEAWKKEPDNREYREGLMDALHELRKVGARLEIELALGERKEAAAKPIPIPAHRAAAADHGNNNDDIGNRADGKRPPRSRTQRPGSSGGSRRPRAKSGD
jgi:hypothetical protein